MWQHRAKASNRDGVSWSLIYRVVKSSVRVTPEGKLWDPHSLGPKKDKDMQKKRKQVAKNASHHARVQEEVAHIRKMLLHRTKCNQWTHFDEPN